MGWITLVLVGISLQAFSGFILPIKKLDGSIDVDRLVSHMTLLEQEMAALQQNSKTQTVDVEKLKLEVSDLKSAKQRYENEIADLKTKFVIFQTQIGTGQLPAEVKVLKSELQSVSSEVIGVRSGLKNLTFANTDLHTKINSTNQSLDKLKLLTESTMQICNSSLQNQENVTDQISIEVNSLRSELQNLTSQNTDLQTRMNFTNLSLENLKLSTESTIQILNNSLHKQENITGIISNEVKGNQNSLQSLQANLNVVNSSLQMNMEDLKQDMKRAIVSVQNETSKFQAELNSTVAAVERQKIVMSVVRDNINKTDQDVQLLKTQVSLLQTRDLNMTHNLQAMSVAVSRMSSILDDLKVEVSFEAENGVHDPKDITVIFKDINHNVGGGYNSTSGKFTAPVSGVYLFWSQIDKRSGQSLTMYLLHNGSGIKSSYLPVDGDVTGTIIAAVQLRAGDTVSMTALVDDIRHDGHSTFGGVLLRKH